MSPELEAALADEDASLALRRFHTYQRLRELNAPLPIIERSSSLLDDSKKKLGNGFRVLVATVYDEYRKIAEASMKEQEEQCQ